MSDALSQVVTDLHASNYLMAQMQLAHQEFGLATRYHRWNEAEEARQRVLDLIEAQMDAYTRAIRASEDIA